MILPIRIEKHISNALRKSLVEFLNLTIEKQSMATSVVYSDMMRDDEGGKLSAVSNTATLINPNSSTRVAFLKENKDLSQKPTSICRDVDSFITRWMNKFGQRSNRKFLALTWKESSGRYNKLWKWQTVKLQRTAIPSTSDEVAVTYLIKIWQKHLNVIHKQKGKTLQQEFLEKLIPFQSLVTAEKVLHSHRYFQEILVI